MAESKARNTTKSVIIRMVCGMEDVMQLPGIVSLKPEQTDLIHELADMMGETFLEELSTVVWLEALDELGADRARKLEISRGVMRCDFSLAAPYGACLMLPDMAAGVGCYLASELEGRTWSEFEDRSMDMLVQEVLSEEEAQVLIARAKEMETITNFDWMLESSGDKDFMHIFSIGVNPNMRGTGAFRRLITPLLDYADNLGVNFYLECYTDQLEGLYGHFGFVTVKELRDPKFDIYERVMMRTPRWS